MKRLPLRAPRTLTARLVVTMVLLVALVSALVVLTTTVATSLRLSVQVAGLRCDRAAPTAAAGLMSRA